MVKTSALSCFATERIWLLKAGTWSQLLLWFALHGRESDCQRQWHGHNFCFDLLYMGENLTARGNDMVTTSALICSTWERIWLPEAMTWSQLLLWFALHGRESDCQRQWHGHNFCLDLLSKGENLTARGNDMVTTLALIYYPRERIQQLEEGKCSSFHSDLFSKGQDLTARGGKMIIASAMMYSPMDRIWLL